MILELHERDTEVLEQILSILKNHPEIEKFEIDEEPMVSLPGLEIFPSRRKVFRDRQEIQLTAKEYRILLLLATNKGRVLTYAQIYEQVWGDFTTGNENNTIGFHICNLREKLYRAIKIWSALFSGFPTKRNTFVLFVSLKTTLLVRNLLVIPSSADGLKHNFRHFGLIPYIIILTRFRFKSRNNLFPKITHLIRQNYEIYKYLDRLCEWNFLQRRYFFAQPLREFLIFILIFCIILLRNR